MRYRLRGLLGLLTLLLLVATVVAAPASADPTVHIRKNTPFLLLDQQCRSTVKTPDSSPDGILFTACIEVYYSTSDDSGSITAVWGDGVDIGCYNATSGAVRQCNSIDAGVGFTAFNQGSSFTSYFTCGSANEQGDIHHGSCSSASSTDWGGALWTGDENGWSDDGNRDFTTNHGSMRSLTVSEGGATWTIGSSITSTNFEMVYP